MLFGNNHAAGMLLSDMLYDMPDGVLYDMSLSSAWVYYDVFHAYLCDIGFFNLDRLHRFSLLVSLLFTNVITAVLSMLLRIAFLLSIACVLPGCPAVPGDLLRGGGMSQLNFLLANNMHRIILYSYSFGLPIV